MKTPHPRNPKTKRISLAIGETPMTKRRGAQALCEVIDGAIATYFPGFFKYHPTTAAISRERNHFIERAVRAVASMVVRDGEITAPLVVHQRVNFQHSRQ